jgi:hypothetical protein
LRCRNADIIIDKPGYDDEIKICYTDGDSEPATNTLNGIFHATYTNKVIEKIVFSDEREVLVGRVVDNKYIALRFDEGNNLVLRDHVDGYSPIGSYAEFQLINTNSTTLAGTYKLEADLDLMNIEWTPVGADETDPFLGIFDGRGYTVSNLNINKPATRGVGLFGSISGEHAIIRNIGVIDGTVHGERRVGAICGFMGPNTRVIACYNENVTVTGSVSIGGICGSSYQYSEIIACYNTGKVSGDLYTGGVVGAVWGNVTACYNTGEVEGDEFVGGVNGGMGRQDPSFPWGQTSACYNTGTVTGNTNVYGVAGTSDGYIYACYCVLGGDATQGHGGSSLGATTAVFSATEWPGLSSASHNNVNWGTGDGSGPGNYWKSLGGPTAGPGNTPAYPKLYFEP